jgi:hypothetical protein
MNAENGKRRAVAFLERLVRADGPPDPRVVHCELETTWYPDLLRTLAEHRLHVLGRSADLVVFLDSRGRIGGWRDDGRRGAEHPGVIDRDVLLRQVLDELGLPAATRAGRLEPSKLPYAGWTHRISLFPSSSAGEETVRRVWVAPGSLKIIQCLHGRTPDPGSAPPGHPDAPAAADSMHAAAEVVRTLLVGRLERAGIPTAKPEWYFQTEATAPVPYSGGQQVRVHTFKHWSNAFVQFEEDQEEPMGWVLDRYADPPTDRAIPEDEAVRLAAATTEIPEDAEPAGFRHAVFAPGRTLTWIEFRRVHQGLRVDGDFLRLSLHPDTHRRVEFRRKWRALRVPRGRPAVTGEEANALVERSRGKLGIDPEMKRTATEKAIVEYKAKRDRPGEAEDRIAWIVELSDPTGWVRVHVDAIRPKILAVLRSA